MTAVSPAKTSVAEIEETLARRLGRRHCVLTNRGTTALAAAFHALDRAPGTRALFPAAMCSIPVFAAGYAGWAPAFADVNLSDANFDLSDVERVLVESKGRIGAVVPIHMFGKMDDVHALRDLCRTHGADLVEDAALSLGARRGETPAGGFGRLATLSFVRKMLPLEMGGAVVTDEPVLAARARAFVAALPPENKKRRGEVSAAMKAFHALTAFVAAGGWTRRDLLAPFAEEFRRLLLASVPEGDWTDSIVLDELDKLDDGVRARRTRAEVYETSLNHPALVLMDRSGSSLFAFPVRLPGFAAEGFLKFAEEHGWSFRRVAYPDISPVFGSERAYPNAALIEKETIGLPVDDHQPVSAFWDYAADFRDAVDQYVRSSPTEGDWRGQLEARMG